MNSQHSPTLWQPKSKKRKSSSDSGGEKNSIEEDSLGILSDPPSDQADDERMIVEDSPSPVKGKISDQPVLRGSPEIVSEEQDDEYDEEDDKEEACDKMEELSGSSSNNILSNWLINP